jgi:hypothetical protein
MKPITFFAHIALSQDVRDLSSPAATANLLVEVNDETLRSGGDDAHRSFSAMSDSQKVHFAEEIGRTAALDFLDSGDEFSTLQVRRFVDFELTEMPCYLSARESPTRTLPNKSKVWRLAQSDSDNLRTEPLSQSS